ncbi:MAG: Zn-dependent hydrolase [Clostridiales Family XIII bacterium]|jgi:N-carbamoyl-L-amino-acid hydrolase|nr:Zn-dependent hydrolase [Clostridiales Family XIII bacterium]
MYETNKDRMWGKIQTWSKFGDLGNGGITRLSLSPEALKARDEFKKRIEKLGMSLEVDDAGNLYATLPGTEEGLKRIVVASHMDSVKNGGNFDGIFGVLSGLEAAETIVTNNIKLRHPLTVMVWTNEEGVRFEPAMMSSGIVINGYMQDTVGDDMPRVLKNYAGEKMFAVKENGGTITFAEALIETGYNGDKTNRISPEKYCAYFEPHIEQGPVLEDGDFQIGVVEGVVGMVNYDIILEGISAHAGTFPQLKRHDALKAASKTILTLWDKLLELDSELVFTTGEITVKPNVHTVVPNYVKFSFDSRHRNPEVLKQVIAIIKNLPKEIEGCKLSYEEHWSRDTVEFNPLLVNCIENACKGLNYSYHKMYSGAGHDAQFANYMLPATMLFIPSKAGLSHTVVEYSSPDQTWNGANVLLNAIIERDKLDD